jgi:1,4-dihydroxy-2-naphthoate octaprenyltransferase
VTSLPPKETSFTQPFTLPFDDPRVEQALRTGELNSMAAVARAVVSGEGGLAQHIVFERIEARRPSGARPWLQAVRAYSLTATLTPCLAMVALQPQAANLGVALLALLGVGLLQVAINVFNDVEDYRKLIDLPDTPGGSGVIQLGWWTPAQLRRLAWSALFFGALCGLPAVIERPWILIPIALLAGLGVLLYSARSLGLKYHALGDLTVLVLCGPALTIGFASAMGQTWGADALWVGGYFGFLAASLLHINNIQDINIDRARGVTTLAMALGFGPSLRLLAVFQLVAALCVTVPVALGTLPTGSLLGVFVQLAMALPWLRKTLRALGPESALLSNSRLKAAQIHLLGGLGLIAGLIIQRTL